jgi:hypothetical protein
MKNIIPRLVYVAILCTLAYALGLAYGLSPLAASLPSILVAIIMALSDNHLATITAALTAAVATVITASGIGFLGAGLLAIIVAALIAALAYRPLKLKGRWLFTGLLAQQLAVFWVLQNGNYFLPS